MIKFQENAWTEGWIEGQKDRQTLFYRTLPATAGGSKKVTNFDAKFLSFKNLKIRN